MQGELSMKLNLKTIFLLDQLALANLSYWLAADLQ